MPSHVTESVSYAAILRQMRRRCPVSDIGKVRSSTDFDVVTAVPFVSKRPKLRLTEEETTWLQQLSQSRSEAAGRVQRAEILLRYHGGETVSGIAAALRTNRPRVERCLAKALELGVRGALQDLPGRGRRPRLTAEARAWVVALACQKPKELGYAQELWTTRLLAQHVRQHCVGRWACEFAALGARNGFQDSARAARATAQDRVLSGAARRRV